VGPTALFSLLPTATAPVTDDFATARMPTMAGGPWPRRPAGKHLRWAEPASVMPCGVAPVEVGAPDRGRATGAREDSATMAGGPWAMSSAASGAAPAMGGACDSDGRRSSTRGSRSSRPRHSGWSSRWIDFPTTASGPRLRRLAEPYPRRPELTTGAQQLEGRSWAKFHLRLASWPTARRAVIGPHGRSQDLS
jgi:hypothetical protein